ncbi:hypothetical protein LTR62_006998 [Meristemomyces frigidus]|uniref:Uncharacterized protein n=1 Tax=Meristemomyces frigidus TaxID=1508187 RepID=A0AAN7YE38_9PEZI|nr:hypothetical protein LTR62_006998 [Meristemomyces frigidus]
MSTLELTMQDVLDRGITTATVSFANTLHFLIAAVITLLVGMVVTFIISKSIDARQDPFIVFKSPVKPVALLASLLASSFLAIQVVGSIWTFLQAKGAISMSRCALTTMAATLGIEAACLVVFGGFSVLAALVAPKYEGIEEAAGSRSRSTRSQ